MKKQVFESTRSGVVLFLCLLFVAAAILLPISSSSESGIAKELSVPALSALSSQGLPNFDIREDDSTNSSDTLIKFRNAAGRDASTVANILDSIVLAEESLRGRSPDVVVEYSGRLAGC